MHLRILSKIALVFGLIFISSVASAEVQVRLAVKTHDDPKRAGQAPDIDATIIGGRAGVPLEKVSLSQSDAKVPFSMKATALKKYSEGTETIAVVVLVEGHEVWMGNETYADNDADKYIGVFSKLVAGLDPISKFGPPGSQGALIVYGQGMEVRHPMGDLTQLTGDKLGTQKDFQGKTSRDLVAGVNEALAQLRKVTTSRKALIIIGDGADTNPDDARKQLAAMHKQIEADHIEIYGIQYVAEGLDNEGGVLKTLTPDVSVAQSADGIGASINALVERLNDRYYLTFPGYDPKLKAGFTWDGKEHEFVVKIDQDELEPQTLAMVPVWHAPGKGGIPWWVWMLAPIVLIILIGVAFKIFGSKPIAPPVVEAAPAPAPAGPMKTVMIGVGGDADGYPVVGWLVPMNGPQAFQTFRLLQGPTKIGTGGEAHVVIDDGFMSTEHCLVLGTPQGFILQDNKSTNGIFVNDQKTDRAELYDNDVITMGKTHVMFKSIN